MVGLPLKLRDTSMTAARPAQAPDTVNAAILTRSTGVPASRAADSE